MASFILYIIPGKKKKSHWKITVIQVYAPTSTAEEPHVEWIYKDLQDLLEHPKKLSFSS